MGRLTASAAAASAALVCTAAASVADTDAVARKTVLTNSPIPALGVLGDAALPPHADAERLRREAGRKLRAAKRRTRHLRRGGGHAAAAPKAAVPPALQAIAACESHGNPRAVGGGGAFRGKYQFDMGTWARVGGKGDPAAAPEAEQDRRAAMLYARSGSSPWPVCRG
jgi:transglycosylase-like protein